MGVAAGETDAPEPAFRFEDPEIVESSGLAVVDGLVATVNDSGDDGRVFAVDPSTGRTVGVTSWEPEPDDIEALAPAGPGHVWVGDIGDNPGNRDTISVYRIPLGADDQEVDVEPIELRYPGGPRDAETLLVHPGSGRVFVVTKDVFGGEVFEVPTTSPGGGVERLKPLSAGRLLSVVTDGTFLPDGEHLVLRTYGRAIVYSWPSLEEAARIDLPPQEQGEGIAVTEDGQLLISSEGTRAPVLEVALPDDLERSGGPTRSDRPSAEASPSEATPSPGSREGAEVPEDSGDRDPVPWLIGTGVAIVALAVLIRALRPTQYNPPR